MHAVLHKQTHTSDANPAAKTHKDWFPTSANQLYDVSVKTNGGHRQHDKKLTQFLNGGKETWTDTHVYSDGSDDGCSDEV